MAPIMSLGLPEVDGELDYTIHGLSGHHTLAETPAQTHRVGEPATGKRTPLAYSYFSITSNGRSKCESWQSGQSERQSEFLEM